MSLLSRFRRTLAERQPQVGDRQALQDLNRSIALIVDPDALQASIAARIHELFRADPVVIFHQNAPGGRFIPSLSVGIEVEELAGISLDRRGRLARWLLVNDACLVVPREPGVRGYLDEPEQQLLERLRVGICVPLVSLNRLTGIIMLGSRDPSWRLDAGDLGLLQLLAGQAAIAFENALLYREQHERLHRLYRADQLAAAGQLAAAVAHDVRNPLTAIRSTIQYILADYPEGSPKRRLVSELLEEVDRIDRTVDGLLTLSRPRPASLERVDLNEIVTASLQLLRIHAERQTVSTHPPGRATPAFVNGDTAELKHLFVNLFMNALQAMPDGGRLAVSVADWRPERAPGGGWILVEVTDSGVGIPPENLEKIFDPFFTTKRDGTGLGLAICHGIVQRHEGELDVRSVPGSGTTVAVRLPAV